MLRLATLIFSFLLLNFAATVSLSAQSSSDDEELLNKLKEMKKLESRDKSESYSTPPIYEDSAGQGSMQLEKSQETLDIPEEEKEGKDKLRRREMREEKPKPDSLEQRIPKPGPDGLRLFGANLFSSSSADFSPAPIASVPPDYKLGPGDNVIVYLWGRIDLEMDLTVDREGKVFVPKAGEITAFNLTLDQFKERLHKKLSNIYSDFELGVMLGRIRTIRVYVYGEVKKPGAYTISSLSTLFNALHYSGGPNENGSLRKIRLSRGKETIATVDLYDFLLHGKNGAGIKLQSEDVIFVPVVGPKVSVRGEVKRPAIYELKNQEQLLDVIELAGGVSDEAYLGRVMIDRINNGQGRKLIDLSLANEEDREKNNIEIKAGDDISVFSIYERRENVVWLDGHVKHPGAYQMDNGLSVSELLGDGKQLKENPYLERADLIRTNSDSQQELIPINLAEALNKNPDHDLKLQVNDSLRIYGSNEIARKKYVSIDGEIRKPGEYQLFKNMRISDLIFMAGDLKRGAYTLTAEVARRTPGKEIELLYIDLAKMKEGDPDADILLAEDDYIFIRKVPAWELDNFVTIAGEVKFPGKYAVYRNDETLYDLIQRAGGLTPEAFAFGTIFIRGEIEDKLERMNLPGILDRSNPVKFDSAGNYHHTSILKYNASELSRMVIDLDLVLSSKGRQGNV
ncbi:MAG: hypothetical protein GF310_05880, partial [candidate division Zixibacteria bacterium]|nr:hypothetical protein [candidate division Zixibacteria bacterium]